MATAAFGADGKPLSDGNLPVVEMSAEELAAVRIDRIPLGQLEVPTGRIVVADPLVNPDRPPLAREVPVGRYPVTLYRAQYRIAMAELRLAPGKVARFEMATIPGQNLAELKDDEIFGYPVDAGTGGFMDASAKAAMDRRETLQIEKQRGTSDRYSNYYDDVLHAEMERNGGNYVLHRPLADDPVNVAIFQSGWGDGFYASYWGLDEAGRPLVLVTDFGVLQGGDGRSDHEKRHAAILAAMSEEQRDANREAEAAFGRGDEAALRAILSAGRVKPDDYLIGEQETLIQSAIRHDKPAMLELLVRYGAPLSIAPDDRSHLADKTYPAFARWLFAKSREEDTARERAKNGYAPISDQLLDVVTRWEAGRIPRAADAPR